MTRAGLLFPLLAVLLVACSRQEQLKIDSIGPEDEFTVNFSSPAAALDTERFYLTCDLGAGFWPDGETPGPRFYLIGRQIEKAGAASAGWQNYRARMSFDSADRDQLRAASKAEVASVLAARQNIDCQLAAKSWHMGQPEPISSVAALPLAAARQWLAANEKWANF